MHISVTHETEPVSDWLAVTSDLVRYMDAAASYGENGDFFVNDPEWAIDFAPNGKFITSAYASVKLTCPGTRVGEGDILTRKRYAK